MLVGTLPQNVRVLPATSGNTLWVILPEGCKPEDPSDCASLCGFNFHINRTSTWSDRGLYKLLLATQSELGYSGNARYGYETVTLGWQGEGLPTLTNQVIAGIAKKKFYIGSLGLMPRPVNFTDFNDPRPSILETLRAQRRIPSSSWSYTAGAYDQRGDSFGSLTLGGYDTSRFVPNNVSFPFSADTSRDLLVGIQSITIDTGSGPLLSSGISALIDSLIPHIWLPLTVCQVFEQTFGLVWDNSSQLYLVDDQTHRRLVQLNANVTFRLGPSLTDGSTVDIRMPYRSFDLTATAPLVRNSTRYFPLKRADSDKQYTLGRTFLQHAYVIADYDRSNFSVHQALFPNRSVSQHIVDILPPGSHPPEKRNTLRNGAIVGIVVGIVFILCAFFTVFIYRRSRRRNQQAEAEAIAKETENLRYQKAELDTTKIATHIGSYGTDKTYDWQSPVQELPGETGHVHELPVQGNIPGGLQNTLSNQNG